MVDPGAFVRCALRYRDVGFIVYPWGGNDGKTPSTRGFNAKRFSRETVEDWVGRAQFQEANIGLSPGLNGLTVLDLDDPAQYRDCIDRFGHTPIQAISPRAGRHLYYRSFGLEADLKGIGGHIVLPPSLNYATEQPYRFDGCVFLDLRPEGLPRIKPEAVPDSREVAVPKPNHEVREGERNNTPFAIARSTAADATSFEEVRLEVLAANAEFPAPLPEGKAQRAAESAWRYKLIGRCFVPGQESQGALAGCGAGRGSEAT